MAKLIRVTLDYDDGAQIIIDSWQMEQLEKAQEAINFFERVKRLYVQLKSIMEKKQ